MHEWLSKLQEEVAARMEEVTTSTSDSQQVASASVEIQQMHEWLSKLQEEVKGLTSDRERVNELCRKTDDLTKQLADIYATPELIEKEVEQRFSHCDQRLANLQHFVSARLEAMNEACGATEKDVAKLREGLREEHWAWGWGRGSGINGGF
eukprot:s79_g22.t1